MRNNKAPPRSTAAVPKGYDLGGFEAIGCVVGIHVEGEEDLTIRNFSVRGSRFGIVADNTKNVTVENANIYDCKTPVTGHGSENLALLNVEINGRKLTDFTGDFDFLRVISADEVLYLGELLWGEADQRNQLAILTNSKLGEFLEQRSVSDWLGLVGVLISLYSVMKN